MTRTRFKMPLDPSSEVDCRLIQVHRAVIAVALVVVRRPCCLPQTRHEAMPERLDTDLPHVHVACQKRLGYYQVPLKLES